jgi:Fur family transcriptional regulator, stress-responsive regulator
VKPVTTSSERDIRAAGLRCTAQRIAVLDVLRSGRRHHRVDEVASLVTERLGAVSPQAVYDALGALVGAKLARRIEPAGSAAMFEARSGDNHHHLVCRGCGATFDIDCVVGTAPCLEASEDLGFVIDEAEVIFWGRCPDCLRATTTMSRTSAGTRRGAGR